MGLLRLAKPSAQAPLLPRVSAPAVAIAAVAAWAVAFNVAPSLTVTPLERDSVPLTHKVPALTVVVSL